MSVPHNLILNCTLDRSLLEQDPAHVAQWIHTLQSTYSALQAPSTASAAAESEQASEPSRARVEGLDNVLHDFLDDQAIDIINRWQSYDRNNQQVRLDLIEAIMTIPYELISPRDRHGDPSGRPYLNITPNLKGTTAEYAGNFNSGRMFFTNARHLVDRDNPLVITTGTYPAVDLYRPGAQEFVLDVLKRYFEECFSEIAGTPMKFNEQS